MPLVWAHCLLHDCLLVLTLTLFITLESNKIAQQPWIFLNYGARNNPNLSTSKQGFSWKNYFCSHFHEFFSFFQLDEYIKVKLKEFCSQLIFSLAKEIKI